MSFKLEEFGKYFTRKVRCAAAAFMKSWWRLFNLWDTRGWLGLRGFQNISRQSQAKILKSEKLPEQPIVKFNL